MLQKPPGVDFCMIVCKVSYSNGHSLWGADGWSGEMAASHCHSWWRGWSGTVWHSRLRPSFLWCLFGLGGSNTVVHFEVVFVDFLCNLIYVAFCQGCKWLFSCWKHHKVMCKCLLLINVDEMWLMIGSLWWIRDSVLSTLCCATKAWLTKLFYLTLNC